MCTNLLIFLLHEKNWTLDVIIFSFLYFLYPFLIFYNRFTNFSWCFCWRSREILIVHKEDLRVYVLRKALYNIYKVSSNIIHAHSLKSGCASARRKGLCTDNNLSTQSKTEVKVHSPEVSPNTFTWTLRGGVGMTSNPPSVPDMILICNLTLDPPCLVSPVTNISPHFPSKKTKQSSGISQQGQEKAWLG
jgi:hypothetical protein